MRGARGLALALCLQIVAANDDKTKCPGNGKLHECYWGPKYCRRDDVFFEPRAT